MEELFGIGMRFDCRETTRTSFSSLVPHLLPRNRILKALTQRFDMYSATTMTLAMAMALVKNKADDMNVIGGTTQD